MTTKTQAAESAIDHESETHDVDIALIDVPDSNPRLKEAESKEQIAALAATLKSHGLLHAIGVKRDGDRYTLAYGSRRLQAAKSIGWKSIAAVVLPDAVDVLQIAMIENDRRRPMTPLEELKAVQDFMARDGADGPRDSNNQRLAAEFFGKSIKWVRDRLFMARLCEQARDLLNDGTMPIGVARELAKLADHKAQVEKLNEWYRGKFPRFPNADAARRECNSEAISLNGVKWDLEAPEVAAGTVACSDCPDNSAVAARCGLFEHDEKTDRLGGYMERGPFCLDGGCFQKKQAAVQQALDVAVKLTVKGKGTEKERTAAAIEALPEFVKDGALKEALGDAATKEKARSQGGGGGKQKSQAQRDREWKAQQRRSEERQRQRRAREKAVLARLQMAPGARTVLFVLSRLSMFAPIFSKMDNAAARERDKQQLPNSLRSLLAAARDGKVNIADIDELLDKEFGPQYGEGCYLKLHARFGKLGKAVLAEFFEPGAAAEGAQADEDSLPGPITRAKSKTKKKAAKKTKLAGGLERVKAKAAKR